MLFLNIGTMELPGRQPCMGIPSRSGSIGFVKSFMVVAIALEPFPPVFQAELQLLSTTSCERINLNHSKITAS